MLFSTPNMGSCSVTTSSSVDKCKSNAFAHDWDEGVVQSVASTNQEGLIKYTCKDCNAVEYKTIAALATPNQYIEGGEDVIVTTSAQTEKATTNNETSTKAQTEKESTTKTTGKTDIATTSSTESVVTSSTESVVESKTTIIKPGKVSIKKAYAKKKSAKKIKLKIKKLSGVKGYQVAVYKTRKAAKKNKSALVKKYIKKNVSQLVVSNKKLKNIKKLYVRVRAYSKNESEIAYGDWSNIKVIKTK